MATPPNILWLMIDSLRADHLGCYGYVHPTSPTIDAVAADGVLVERCYANAVPTHPAMATLWTGRHPLAHGIVSQSSPEARFSAGAGTLAEVLSQRGYHNVAIDTVADRFDCFSRGFHETHDPGRGRSMKINVPALIVAEHAMKFLVTQPAEPFFCHVHLWDTHAPYTPPPLLVEQFRASGGDETPLSELDKRPMIDAWADSWFSMLSPGDSNVSYIRAAYDAAIRYCDEHVGFILATLERAGLASNTIVIISSDHGESLNEHDVYFEHHGLHECVIRTPMIVRCPELGMNGGQRVKSIIEHQDIAPTLLEMIDLPERAKQERFPAPPTASIEDSSQGTMLSGQTGVSRLDAFRGEADRDEKDRMVIGSECTWQASRYIRQGPWKLISYTWDDIYCKAEPELYNLDEDPDELDELSCALPEVAESLQEQLNTWVETALDAYGYPEDPLVDPGVSIGRQWLDNRRMV